MKMSRKLVLAVAAVAVAWGWSAGTAQAQTGSYWRYKEGYFRVTGNKAWSEYKQGKVAYTFVESYRDNDEVHLHDSSRGITVKVRGGKAEIWSGTDLLGTIEGGQWYWLGWKTKNKKSHFLHVGGGKWEERQDGKVAYTFKETYRSGGEIHLYDSSRGFTIKLKSDHLEILSGADTIGNFPGTWSE